jgi:hypothetical protein
LAKRNLEKKVLNLLASNPDDWFSLDELAEVLLGSARFDDRALAALSRAIVALDLEDSVSVRMAGPMVSYGHRTQKRAIRVTYVPGNRGGYTNLAD